MASDKHIFQAVVMPYLPTNASQPAGNQVPEHAVEDQTPASLAAAHNTSTFLYKIVPSFREQLIRYLAVPTGVASYTYSSCSSDNLGAERHKPDRMAIALGSTCRLLHSEVKRIWLRDNIFLFYDPRKLTKFINSIVASPSFMSNSPLTFKHVVLNVKTCDASAWYLRNGKHTTIVPLSMMEVNRTPTTSPHWTTIGWGLQLVVTNPTSPAPAQIDYRMPGTKELWRPIRDPQPAEGCWRHLLAQERARQPAQPAQPPLDQSGLAQWFANLQFAVFEANARHDVLHHIVRDSEYWGGSFEKIRCDGLTEVQTPYAFPPDPASALQLSITDVAYLRMLNEASDTTFWLEGIELLLKHFKVERMDIVYDDPIEAWQYMDDGTA